MFCLLFFYCTIEQIWRAFHGNKWANFFPLCKRMSARYLCYKVIEVNMCHGQSEKKYYFITVNSEIFA